MNEIGGIPMVPYWRGVRLSDLTKEQVIAALLELASENERLRAAQRASWADLSPRHQRPQLCNCYVCKQGRGQA